MSLYNTPKTPPLTTTLYSIIFGRKPKPKIPCRHPKFSSDSTRRNQTADLHTKNGLADTGNLGCYPGLHRLCCLARGERTNPEPSRPSPHAGHSAAIHPWQDKGSSHGRRRWIMILHELNFAGAVAVAAYIMYYQGQTWLRGPPFPTVSIGMIMMLCFLISFPKLPSAPGVVVLLTFDSASGTALRLPSRAGPRRTA